ncbi:hypothetical protein LCGC14_2792490, partial [marine sediment metagenome]
AASGVCLMLLFLKYQVRIKIDDLPVANCKLPQLT